MPGFVISLLIVVVAIPVVFGVLLEGYKRHLKFKERQMQFLSAETAEKAAQYAAHTERLEQRVRVLERIVTDKGVDLSAEIELLRDKPLN
jgi:UPF0716 family protein affecting phage T7 exclusion